MPLFEDAESLWELFHENSKIGRYSETLSKEEVLARMREFHESLTFEGYPVVPLPHDVSPLSTRLDDAIVTRISIRDLSPGRISLNQLTCLLHYSYGITREANADTVRSFRTVPSGGALYPLE